MLHINKIVNKTSTEHTFDSPHVLTYQVPKPELTRKLYAEVCISVNESPTCGKSLAMVDSGCDIPLITEDHLSTLFGNEWKKIKLKIKPTNVSLCSFTNDTIPLPGTLNINISFGPTTKTLPVTFHIIKRNFHSPCPIVFGLKTLLLFKVDISSKTTDDGTIPCLRKRIGQRMKQLPSFYLADNELKAGFSRATLLQPGEHKTIRLYLPEHSHLLPGSSVLSTSLDLNPTHMNKCT